MDKKTLASYLDLANHQSHATEEKIRILCQKVKEFGFHSAFVNPCYVPLVKEELAGVAAVGTVVGFPLGQEKSEVKIYAAQMAVKVGADELDISTNTAQFIDKKYQEALEEMRAIVEKVREINKETVVKFIIETGCLTDEEIKKAAELILQSGADFVKICSGFGPRGASLHDVELVKSVVADKIKIKVAGGIATYQQAIDFIKAGASRIGSSRAVEIVSEVTSYSSKNGE